MAEQKSVAQDAEPTLADAIDELIRQRIEGTVHTCLPGYVTSYDAAKQEAHVQVVVQSKTVDEDGNVIKEKFAIIPNVPLQFPETAGFFISLPVAVGDFVWLHFAEQSLDAWLTLGGKDVDDPSLRRFSLHDCFAVLGRDPKAPINETKNNAIVVGAKGASDVRAYFKQSEIALGSENPTEFVALATKVLTELNALRTNMIANYSLIATGIVAAGGTYSPVAPSAVNSVASTKVKAV